MPPQLLIQLLQLPVFILEQSSVFELNVHDPLKSLMSALEEDLVVISSGFQVGKYLLIPKDSLKSISLCLEVIIGSIVPLSEEEST
jgi:hypothetical protein